MGRSLSYMRMHLRGMVGLLLLFISLALLWQGKHALLSTLIKRHCYHLAKLHLGASLSFASSERTRNVLLFHGIECGTLKAEKLLLRWHVIHRFLPKLGLEIEVSGVTLDGDSSPPSIEPLLLGARSLAYETLLKDPLVLISLHWNELLLGESEGKKLVSSGTWHTERVLSSEEPSRDGEISPSISGFVSEGSLFFQEERKEEEGTLFFLASCRGKRWQLMLDVRQFPIEWLQRSSQPSIPPIRGRIDGRSELSGSRISRGKGVKYRCEEWQGVLKSQRIDGDPAIDLRDIELRWAPRLEGGLSSTLHIRQGTGAFPRGTWRCDEFSVEGVFEQMTLDTHASYRLMGGESSIRLSNGSLLWSGPVEGAVKTENGQWKWQWNGRMSTPGELSIFQQWSFSCQGARLQGDRGWFYRGKFSLFPIGELAASHLEGYARWREEGGTHPSIEGRFFSSSLPLTTMARLSEALLADGVEHKELFYRIAGKVSVDGAFDRRGLAFELFSDDALLSLPEEGMFEVAARSGHIDGYCNCDWSGENLTWQGDIHGGSWLGPKGKLRMEAIDGRYEWRKGFLFMKDLSFFFQSLRMAGEALLEENHDHERVLHFYPHHCRGSLGKDSSLEVTFDGDHSRFSWNGTQRVGSLSLLVTRGSLTQKASELLVQRLSCRGTLSRRPISTINVDLDVEGISSKGSFGNWVLDHLSGPLCLKEGTRGGCYLSSPRLLAREFILPPMAMKSVEVLSGEVSILDGRMDGGGHGHLLFAPSTRAPVPTHEETPPWHLLIPVCGRVDWSWKKNKIFIDGVSDLYTQGKLAEISLSHDEEGSIDMFHREIALPLEIRYHRPLVKGQQTIRLSIHGPWSAPLLEMKK